MGVHIIKYLRVSKQDEEGNEIGFTSLYLPSIIEPKDVQEITPEFTSSGKIYKNVSNIKYYSGDYSTVMGNYKELNKRFKKERININGFRSKRTEGKD